MKRFRCNRGQDIIEFAFVFPLLLLLLLSIVEGSMLMLSYDTIANAAREGARHGIIHPEDNTGIEAAARLLTVGLNQSALQITPVRVGGTIQVEVTYDHSLITGVIVQAMGINPTLHLHTVATMRIE